MKKFKLFKLLLILLIIFFSLQFFSHLFLKLGQRGGDPFRIQMLKVSAALFPLEAELIHENAFARLEQGRDPLDVELIQASIREFKRSIHLNFLYFRSYLNLGQSYYLLDSQGLATLEDYLPALKRAALIRWNNFKVSQETLKTMLSLWPLLEENDRRYTRSLLRKAVTVMSRDEFAAVLTYWTRTCRNLELFKGVLDSSPAHYKALADALVSLERDLSERYRFKVLYEQYVLNSFREQYRRFMRRNTLDLKNLEWLFSHLNQGIKGYYRQVETVPFSEVEYLAFKKKLMLEILQLLMANRLGDVRDKVRIKIENYVLEYFRCFESVKDLGELKTLMERYKYYAGSDLQSIYMKILFQLRMGDVTRAIQLGEDTRLSFSFVREAEKRDYLQILLLMVNGYMAEGQYGKAREVLDEAERLDQDNMEAGWRRCQMLNVKSRAEETGDRSQNIEERRKKIEKREILSSTNTEDLVGDRDSELEDKCVKIKNSRMVDLNRSILKKTVFLMDEAVMILNLNEVFREKIKDKHLLQVFVDGWIYFEQYLSQVKEKVEVKVEGKEWEKVEVEVRIR